MTQVLSSSSSPLFTKLIRPYRITIVRSLAAAFLFLCVIVTYLFYKLQSSSSSTKSNQDLVPPKRGHFSGLLFDQGLSSDQFHVRNVKLQLASLVRKHSRVAIVGVEGGVDVRFLAVDGYDVYAFEPMSKSLTGMMKWVRESKVEQRVHPYRVAASHITGGNITVTYTTKRGKQKERAKGLRIDDVIKGPLDVLSIDIQGGEWDVLRGAMKIVKGPGVRSMWIEIHSCNKKVPPMLRTLDKLGYALFDLVPLGATYDSLIRESLIDAPNAMGKRWYIRPSRFDNYFNWMCGKLRKDWKWIETDVIAVQRELLTPQVLLSLKYLGADVLLKYKKEKKLD